MAITEVLRLLIDADTRGAVQGVEGLGRTAERELSRSEKSLDRWGNRLTTVGAGLIGFGSVAAAGLGKAAMAASDLEETVSKSSTIFGPAAAGVERFAESAQEIGLSKQAALDAASGFGNLFTQVGLSRDSAADMSIQMARLASDFASFHNADITEVLEAQQAAFRGEYDALQRFVPTINAAAVQQRALADTGKDSADALNEGEKAAATYALMLDGAGAAAGDFERTSDSAANKQRKLSAAFANLEASIGQGALPVFETLVDVANTGIGAFSRLDDATGGLAGKVATIGTVAALGLGGLSLLVGQAIKARDNFRGLTDVLSSQSSRIRGVAVALGAVGAALTTIELLTAANERSAKNWLEDRVGEVDTSNLTQVRDAIRETREELDKLDDREGKGRLFSVGGVNVFATGGDRERQDRIDATREKLAELEAQERSLVGAQGEVAASYAGTDQALAGLNERQAEAITSLSEYEDKLHGLIDPLFGLADALSSNEEAQAGVLTAQEAYNDAVEEFGARSPEAAAAQRDLEAAQRSAAGSALDVTGATAQLNAAVAANPALLEESKAKLGTWVAQGLITRETADEIGRQFDDTALRALALGQTDPNVAVSETGTGGTRTLLDRATEAALRLGGQRPNVHTSTTGSGEARSALWGVRDAAFSIPTSRHIDITATIHAGLQNIFGGLRAHGGPVDAGRLYEVGEQGRAELLRMSGHTYLIPGSDGTVVPSGAWGGAGTGGGAASVVVELNATVVANDPEAVMTGLIRHLRTNGAGELKQALGVR
jgi:hypothetical protein